MTAAQQRAILGRRRRKIDKENAIIENVDEKHCQTWELWFCK
jgi:hypothetical protein